MGGVCGSQELLAIMHSIHNSQGIDGLLFVFAAGYYSFPVVDCASAKPWVGAVACAAEELNVCADGSGHGGEEGGGPLYAG